jgi:hypothetical protein
VEQVIQNYPSVIENITSIISTAIILDDGF